MTDEQPSEPRYPPEYPATGGRVDPPYIATETAMLEAWLDFHRATLLAKCAGLDEAQLRSRSVPPSNLSLLGLVRHLIEVEHSWFVRNLAGEDVAPTYYSEADPDGDFNGVESADPQADLAALAEAIQQSRQQAARYPDLDAVAARKRRGQDVSLRWIYVHMIEEYARHNGHADLLRERIDGMTGE